MSLLGYRAIQTLLICLCMLNSCRAFIFRNPRLHRSQMSAVTATPATYPIVSAEVQQERDRFAAYVFNRNWKFCESYWSRTIKYSCYALPPFIEGDVVSTYSPNSYGVSNLSVVREAGMKGEFISKNDRYKNRQTFALRIGYDGNQYHGYQKQTYCPGLTVEGDLTVALERNTIGAGRTDRGVSGISQVICFATQDMTVNAEDLVAKFKESVPYKEGRLAVYDCQRVPKKFHSRASATWRRYLYLFPLNRIDGAKECGGEGEGSLRGVYSGAAETRSGDNVYDVDIDYLNRMLSRLEGQDLPYNAFAFKEDRNAGQGLQDRCTLFRVRARVVDLAECAPGQPWGPTPVPIALDPALVRTKRKWEETGAEQQAETEGLTADPMIVDQTVASEAVGTASVGKASAAAPADRKAGKAQKKRAGGDADADSEPAEPAEAEDEEGGGEGAEGRMYPFTVDTTTVQLPAGAQVPALCIELVGSRFLRRMVRILTATAIREATVTADTTNTASERNENVLVDICNSGDRERAARALPGPPLCLAGVGYDAHDLALYKFMPKVEHNARLAEQKLEKAAWAKSLQTGSS